MIPVMIEGLGPCEVRLDCQGDIPVISHALAYMSSGERLAEGVRQQANKIRECRQLSVHIKRPVVINRKSYVLKALVSGPSDNRHVQWSCLEGMTPLARQKLRDDTALCQRVVAAADGVLEQVAEQALDLYYTDVASNWRNALKVAQDLLDSLPQVYRPGPMRLCVVIEGGLVQTVLSDDPRASSAVDVMVVDYETDGAADAEVCHVLQGDGSYSEAFVVNHAVNDRPDIDLDQVWRIDLETNPYGLTTEQIATGIGPEEAYEAQLPDGTRAPWDERLCAVDAVRVLRKVA